MATETGRRWADILSLTLRALIVQVLVGAPAGMVDLPRVLTHVPQECLAWPISYAFGCFRLLGVPFILGGALIGASERKGHVPALLLAALPTAIAAGGYLLGIVGIGRMAPSPGATLGGVLALWLLGAMVALVGYALGRIYRIQRTPKEAS